MTAPHDPWMVTVIGRGHSGTRAMAETLSASGVYMGEPLNRASDLLPPDAMYEACRLLSRQVRHRGGTDWDLRRLCDMPPDPAFERLIRDYLSPVLSSNAPRCGWKIPETILCLPWIVRMFPSIRCIYWIRDPRDCILGKHLTDDLATFDVPCEPTDDILLRRAISWKYQAEIVRATSKPAHWITVRFEDFVLDQERTLERLSRFLGIELTRVPVRPESVGRWKTDPAYRDFDFLETDLIEFGYL